MGQILNPQEIERICAADIVDLIEELANGITDPKCYRCGYCCQSSACCYGQWDPQAKACKSLKPVENSLEFTCEKYDEIVVLEKGEKYPMMGGGCSSTLFNDQRDEVRKESVNG